MSNGLGKDALFAQVPRHVRVRVKYQDQAGATMHEWFEGFPAHILQHEIDHLNGMLFVDKVEDTTTYMTRDMYQAMNQAAEWTD